MTMADKFKIISIIINMFDQGGTIEKIIVNFVEKFPPTYICAKVKLTTEIKTFAATQFLRSTACTRYDNLKNTKYTVTNIV